MKKTKEQTELSKAAAAMGRKGGKATAKKLTQTQRSASASHAAKAQAARMTPEQRSERARKAGKSQKIMKLARHYFDSDTLAVTLGAMTDAFNLNEVAKRGLLRKKQCCSRDHDHDGNCNVHHAKP